MQREDHVVEHIRFDASGEVLHRPLLQCGDKLCPESKQIGIGEATVVVGVASRVAPCDRWRIACLASGSAVSDPAQREHGCRGRNRFRMQRRGTTMEIVPDRRSDYDYDNRFADSDNEPESGSE